ncbi:DUF6194 family protein [Leifsonia aquatica]|uniref:DUF6194 family protein n=1 Tax=Leifsonia aquatica TaxID=144185 RepID=UPI00384E4938
MDTDSMDRIIAAVRALDGALVLRPEPGDGSPELAWGDTFCFFAPDGQVPSNTQPYATIVTKDYPEDTLSALGGDRWRVNIQVGRKRLADLVGDGPHDPAAVDALVPHPVYGSLGWVAVVLPGERTLGTVLDLVRDAHDDALRRADRRAARDL